MKKMLIYINVIIVTMFSFLVINFKNEIVLASVDKSNYDVVTEQYLSMMMDETMSESNVYSSNITTYDNFLSSYYDNLTCNFGMNYKNSCGYVGIGMLLSYYDTYLNDSIIPENYDVTCNGTGYDMTSRRNSPGTFREVIYNPNTSAHDSTYILGMSALNYYAQMQSIQNISLHSKLITIGGELGYYDFEDPATPAGTLCMMRRSILVEYLTHVAGITSFDYEIEVINHETNKELSPLVRQFTIEKLKQGQPVLLALHKAHVGGHVVIAYEYDEDNDKIYANFGWNAKYTHINPEEEGFTTYKSALAINWDIEHEHTNNYSVTTLNYGNVNTNYYCYLDKDIYNFEHNHAYDFEYEDYSDDCHKSFCHCGEYIVTESHTYETNDDNICTKCGHLVHVHDYASSHTWLNNTNHRSMCECGEFKIMPHVVKQGTSKCILCNGNASMGIVQWGLNNHNKLYISENGSYILENGIIVLVEEDINLYFNGTLIFYRENDEINYLQ